MLYTPKDNDEIREKYEDMNKGICGPAVLAVLARCDIKEIMDLWNGLYEGYAPLHELKTMLDRLGFKYKFHNGEKSKVFPHYMNNKKHILRIQWLGNEGGDFHGYSNWHDATCNTHYILVDGDMVFCNMQGWFELQLLPEYLEKGYITSYMEVFK